ncbi:MAG: 4-hydroxy-tetrahydrodipicolinate synthase [Lentisphaeria bacterium]|nr:4-hydroxy-tetrahydrodipicolinate synthase [Lentisphaeria bacterium]MBR4884404.1 4-hydroxy-tetrahydrodipicolinate synthase [Lentisphaeria bacterium]
MELKGVYTAIATPFNKDGGVDYGKFEALIEMQIRGGVSGILPVGTSGESPTLNMEEHSKVISTAVRVAAGRCKIMAGSGANCTAEAIELTKRAKEDGADCSLQVTPYYNKPTQEGLYRHFSTIADTCDLPIVLYNVPGRTGIPIAVDTIARLASNPNVLGVKEAGGSVDRVSEILDACETSVMCGDDSLTVPMMSVGAKGVISVASNVIPAEMQALCDACEAGDFATALAIHKKYYKLFRHLFIESNPIPVKAALAMMGLIEEEYRLPLCPLAAKNREILAATMKGCGLI